MEVCPLELGTLSYSTGTLKAGLFICAILVLLGTNLFTYYATREATIEDLLARFRAEHTAILRDEGFTKHEQLTVSGVDLERRLIQTELKAGGIRPPVGTTLCVLSTWFSCLP